MAGDTESQVLLTGATGFIGFKTLLELLSSSHSRVRVAVRDTKRAESLFSNPALTAILSNPSALTHAPPPAPELVAVPDITAKGAYDEAIKGITHVIHVASPLPRANPNGHLTAKESFITPAVRGALEILDAAYKTPSVQRVVITSSVVAIVPSQVWRSFEVSDEQYGPDKIQDFWEEPYKDEAEAYGASKTAQQQAIQKWVEEKKPKFDVITMHPSWVLGRADVATSVEGLWYGTNKHLLASSTSSTDTLGNNGHLTGAVVSVGDVARAHVKALDLEKQDGVRRFALSRPGRFEDIPAIIEKHFGQEVKDGILSNEGKQKTSPLKFDGSDTERALGFTYETLEEMLVSLLEQYVALYKQEKSA